MSAFRGGMLRRETPVHAPEPPAGAGTAVAGSAPGTVPGSRPPETRPDARSPVPGAPGEVVRGGVRGPETSVPGPNVPTRPHGRRRHSRLRTVAWIVLLVLAALGAYQVVVIANAVAGTWSQAWAGVAPTVASAANAVGGAVQVLWQAVRHVAVTAG